MIITNPVTAEYTPISDTRIDKLAELAVRQGARIRILRRIKVNQYSNWKEAVYHGGPNTPGYYKVLHVGGRYLPIPAEMVEKDIVLLNYVKGCGWDEALAFGGKMKLKKTSPREVFVIGEKYPNLNDAVVQDPMCVVSTLECTFMSDLHTCGVLWQSSAREAVLRKVRNLDAPYNWFSFSG